MTDARRPAPPPVTPLRLVTDAGERVPPTNVAVEQSLLGALLVQNAAYHRVSGFLRAEHFSYAVHARIYDAIARLINTGTPANPPTLKHFFDADGALKDLGGARYLARLARSAITVTNTEDYAGIIVELATRRELITTSEETLEAAYVVVPDRSTADILAQAQTRLEAIRATGIRSRLAALDLVRFQALEVPEIEKVIDPWLPSKGLAMIYAWRGIGKTLLALSCAYAIATGTPLLKWGTLKKRVLYVDSEMPVRLMQLRLAALEAAHDTHPGNYFRMLSGDATPDGLPDLSTPGGLAQLDGAIGDAEVVFLDNLSTLLRSARENEGDDSVAFQEWQLKQRRHGRAVVMVHHAGKTGMQRGTSRREDVLDTVISLRRPEGYTADQGARFIVELDKARSVWGEEARGFIAQYEEDRDGAAQWTLQDLADPFGQVADLHRQGKSVRAIADETGLSKSAVARRTRTLAESAAD
jgi:hypothetical protein